MIAGQWYVQHAAIWHWYLPLCVYIFVEIVLFLSIPFFIQLLNLKSINLMKSMIPACPGPTCFFEQG